MPDEANFILAINFYRMPNHMGLYIDTKKTIRQYFGLNNLDEELEKCLNHDQFKFKFMCIECISIEKLRDYLIPKGYYLLDKLSQ